MLHKNDSFNHMGKFFFLSLLVLKFIKERMKKKKEKKKKKKRKNFNYIKKS